MATAPKPNPADKLAAVSNVPATRPRTMAEEITALIPQFNRAAPNWQRKIGGGDTLARIALTELRKTPRLGECSKDSFYGALMTCAQVGLLPGPLGHVYLIPRRINDRMTVCFEFGYRGLLDLARRSGDIGTIGAQCVYEGEKVTINLGTNEVDHPYDHTIDRSDDKKILFVYAMAQLKDGSKALEVMTRAEIESIRKRAKAKDNGPWVTDWAMMARKTVLKRLCTKGQIPLATEILEKISTDETVRTPIDIDPVSAYEDDGIITLSSEEARDVADEVAAEEKAKADK